MGNINRPTKDKFKKLVLQQNTEKKPMRPKSLGENAKTMPWMEHGKNHDVIDNYTTVIDMKAYVTRAAPGSILYASFETIDRYGASWIICQDIATGNELFRKNTNFIDTVMWDFEEDPDAK